jgi:hypothetical protein
MGPFVRVRTVVMAVAWSRAHFPDRRTRRRSGGDELPERRGERSQWFAAGPHQRAADGNFSTPPREYSWKTHA